MISEVSRGVRGYWLCGPPAAAATSADSRRRALREVDKSQWTIPKVQACEQFIQAQAYSLEPDDPPESPALSRDRLCSIFGINACRSLRWILSHSSARSGLSNRSLRSASSSIFVSA